MSKTLLQIVKNTLETMDSDPVDAIFLSDGGTEESEQVANFASQLYEYFNSIYDWPHIKILTKLDSLADNTKPNYLKVPANVGEVLWMKYREQKVKYLSPKEFIEFTNQRNKITKDGGGIFQETLADDTVEITSFQSVPLYIKTNSDPTYYTSFDNEYLVFDSYSILNESTLQQTNSTIYAVQVSTFLLQDDYIPDFPDNMYPLFQAELNRECSLRLKQVDSPVDAKRALVSLSIQRTKLDKLNKKRTYGFGRK